MNLLRQHANESGAQPYSIQFESHLELLLLLEKDSGPRRFLYRNIMLHHVKQQFISKSLSKIKYNFILSKFFIKSIK